VIVEIRILRRTHRSVMVDELTRLYNYRYFQERVAAEARRAERYGSSLALLMADADDFKAYNDAHGHLAGNVALRRLARVLRRSVREVDVVARYGGEEFAILLPATPKLAALRVAEKVRLAVQRAAIAPRQGAATAPLTISVGVASLPGDAGSAQELVARADRALYAAKSQGKNRVVPFSDERREHPRLPASLPGRFGLLSDDMRPLTTRNLSEGGLLFVSGEPVAAGGVARVQLALPPTGEPCECVMRVARASRCADGWHVSGPILHMPRPHARRFRLFLQDLREQAGAARRARGATSARTRGHAAS
jgi:diguanylate cyclase (GGDEF)-like protein